MNRYSKLVTILTLFILFFVVFTGLASADVLRGEGWLYAKGSGLAKLRMSGQVEIIGHGVGAVYVYGADDIEARGRGRRVDRPNGAVIFYGYEGQLNLSGERMVVKMIGKQIEFTAEGKGTAVLRGRGTYETGNGRLGDWAPDGLHVDVAEE